MEEGSLEPRIGEVIDLGGKRLRCVEASDGDSCYPCAGGSTPTICLPVRCCAGERKDKKEIILEEEP